MVADFITSFKLKNTYTVNTIIYAIRRFPFVNKILPQTLYQNKGLKILGNLISILLEIIQIFLGKLLYILFMIGMMIPLYKTNQTETFLHLFAILTICGGLFNTYMFNPTKDKYYAMMIMRMDARSYTLSNYYYSMIKIVIGFLPFTLLGGLHFHVPLWICLFLPLFVVMVKTCFNYHSIKKFEKTGKALNENLPQPIVWVMTPIILAIAYGLPGIQIVLTIPLFVGLMLLTTILGSYCLFKIHNFKQYKQMYKQILTEDNVYAVEQAKSTEMMKENMTKQIVLDQHLTSHKTGFAYFHELFVKRHSKILTKTVKKQTFVILLIIIACIFLIFINKDTSKSINRMLLTYLPYFVFIMYMLNRGTAYTQAMFMNCDHSMLTYRIYRTPKVLLGMFKERLKTLILINLMPAITLSMGLCFLLFLTGGTDNIINYMVLFLSIIAMSIFFSVHYLVMYYLLQPYDVQTKMKSSTYSVVQGITYFVCYYMINIKLPTLYFGATMILFSITYSVISLLLVYRLAPKTFKLQI